MVVPASHVEFSEDSPCLFGSPLQVLNNVPEPIKCTGVKFDPLTDTFTCFAPLKFAQNGLTHLQENPVISLVGVELHTYEGYQYKGPYISHRDCTPEEVEFQLGYYERFHGCIGFLWIFRTWLFWCICPSTISGNCLFRQPRFLISLQKMEQVVKSARQNHEWKTGKVGRNYARPSGGNSYYRGNLFP